MADAADTPLTGLAPARPAADLALRFWQLWETGPDPDVRQFLRENDPLNADLFAIACCAPDQRQRWQARQAVAGRDLPAAWWPHLDGDPELGAGVGVRRIPSPRASWGSRPTLPTTCAASPSRHARFRQQLSLHAALADGDSQSAAATSDRVGRQQSTALMRPGDGRRAPRSRLFPCQPSTATSCSASWGPEGHGCRLQGVAIAAAPARGAEDDPRRAAHGDPNRSRPDCWPRPTPSPPGYATPTSSRSTRRASTPACRSWRWSTCRAAVSPPA